MIFLLNREYILWEIVELARLQMCDILKVPPSAIEASLDLAKEKLSPEFKVDANQCKGVSPDDIREVMGSVYGQCKQEMLERFKGMSFTRQEYLERFCWNEEEAQKEAS